MYIYKYILKNLDSLLTKSLLTDLEVSLGLKAYLITYVWWLGTSRTYHCESICTTFFSLWSLRLFSVFTGLSICNKPSTLLCVHRSVNMQQAFNSSLCSQVRQYATSLQLFAVLPGPSMSNNDILWIHMPHTHVTSIRIYTWHKYMQTRQWWFIIKRYIREIFGHDIAHGENDYYN